MSSRKFISPFSDGSDEDNESWEIISNVRRKKMSSRDVIEKILKYLEQGAEIAEMDMRRFRDKDGSGEFLGAKERKDWFESMIYWVKHNI